MCKSKIAIIILIIFTMLTSTACGVSEGVSHIFGQDKQIKYEKSNILYFPIEQIRTLNPAISKDEDAYYIGKLIYQGLFKLDEKLMPQNELVSSYQYSDDKQSLVLDLRNDVMWHDGEKFTGQDVKYSVDLYKSLSGSNETIYGSYVKNIKSVQPDKNNEYRVTIYYNNDVETNINNLIFPILPAHQYKNISNLKKDMESFIPIGTGPYKVKSYNNHIKLELEANGGYKGQVPTNSLVFQVLPEKRNAISLMDINDITMMFDNEMDRETLLSNNDVNILNYPSNKVEFIGFNFSKPFFKDKRVRQAIAYATDNQSILEAGYYKNGVLVDSLLPPNYFGVENLGDQYEYNLKKSKALLASLGYLERDGDGYIENAKDEEIKIEILINSEDLSRSVAAQVLKESLDKLQITVVIDYEKSEKYNSKIYSGDYDIYIGGYEINERYDLRSLLHSEYGNILRYSNKKVDQYVSTMVGSVSNDVKKEKVEALKEVLIDEIPYYCLFYKTYGVCYTDAVRGKPTPIFNNIYNGCGDLYCEYKIEEK